MLAPDAFADALDRDVLCPLADGFLFGRLIGVEGQAVTLLPPEAKRRIVDEPAWLARPMRLVREL